MTKKIVTSASTYTAFKTEEKICETCKYWNDRNGTKECINCYVEIKDKKNWKPKERSETMEKICETCKWIGHKHYDCFYCDDCENYNNWKPKEKLILRNQQSETMCEHEYIEKKVKDIRGNPCTEVRCKHCDKHIGFNVGVGTMKCEKCESVKERCILETGIKQISGMQKGMTYLANNILEILKKEPNVFENEDDIQAEVCKGLSEVCEMLSTETNNAEQKNKFLKHAEVFKNFSKVFKGVKQNEK